MFSTTAPDGMTIFLHSNKEIISPIRSQPLHYNLDDANVQITNESTPETDSIIDIPISDGFDENACDNLGLEGSSISSYEPYDPIVLSGLSSLSASLQKVVGFPLFDTIGFNGVNTHNHTESKGQDLTCTETLYTHTAGTEVKVSLDEAETLESDQLQSSSAFKNSSLQTKDSEERMQCKDDISAVLNSESILVLMSRRNVTRGITCKPSSFSCIKFYRNFDVPLGKFLRDNLLNQVS